MDAGECNVTRVERTSDVSNTTHTLTHKYPWVSLSSIHSHLYWFWMGSKRALFSTVIDTNDISTAPERTGYIYFAMIRIFIEPNFYITHARGILFASFSFISLFKKLWSLCAAGKESVSYCRCQSSDSNGLNRSQESFALLHITCNKVKLILLPLNENVLCHLKDVTDRVVHTHTHMASLTFVNVCSSWQRIHIAQQMAYRRRKKTNDRTNVL